MIITVLSCDLHEVLDDPFLQAKKDVAQIFNNILRRQIGTRSPTVEYVCTKSEILFILIRG